MSMSFPLPALVGGALSRRWLCGPVSAELYAPRNGKTRDFTARQENTNGNNAQRVQYKKRRFRAEEYGLQLDNACESHSDKHPLKKYYFKAEFNNIALK